MAKFGLPLRLGSR